MGLKLIYVSKIGHMEMLIIAFFRSLQTTLTHENNT